MVEAPIDDLKNSEFWFRLPNKLMLDTDVSY